MQCMKGTQLYGRHQMFRFTPQKIPDIQTDYPSKNYQTLEIEAVLPLKAGYGNANSINMSEYTVKLVRMSYRIAQSMLIFCLKQILSMRINPLKAILYFNDKHLRTLICWYTLSSSTDLACMLQAECLKQKVLKYNQSEK